MAADTPGTTPGSYLTMSKVQRTIEPGIYDRAKFLPRLKEFERGYNQLTVRKAQAATGGVLGSTDDGTGVSFQTFGLSPVTMTPTLLYTAHQFPDTMENRGGDEIDPTAAENVKVGLGNYLDYTLLQNLATLTQFIGGDTYDLDTAEFRNAIATLYNSGKMEAEPGEVDIYGILGALQVDDAMSIPELTHADQRGDGENPLVKGMVSKGSGVNLHFTTLLYNDGTQFHGGLWVRRCIGYFFNKRIYVERQRYLMANRLFAACEVASNVVHNQLGVGIRHKLT